MEKDIIKIWPEEVRRELPTGIENFDNYFKILSGTFTIFYVCNQTYNDIQGVLGSWINNLFDDEIATVVSTYSDVMTVIRGFMEKQPHLVEKSAVLTRDGRTSWIDMYTLRGFNEVEAEKVMVNYYKALKSLNYDENLLFMVKMPERCQSVKQLYDFLNEIMERNKGYRGMRIMVFYGDDLVDTWGPKNVLNVLKTQVNRFVHKLQHAYVYIFSYKGHLPKFHTFIERMADNILLWGFDGEREEKFLQILKTPILNSFYGKVPYVLNQKGLPEFTV
ncbi:MAG: hypothetical protein Q6362_008755 [Candidatus Wukongarchaeota archaeon]|nr:hypothetical protein [Candidatus Wukongarchaeota archaeon]MDO8129502.1 hypothetical protein [Candidatus Wukongarchaeota archaeon]